VSGPRVSLYSGTASSSLSLNLANSNKKKKNLLLEDEDDDDDDDDDEVVVNVKPDRNVRTGGSPAHCVSYRDDGRLVAIGTDDGCIKVCDATSRATIRTFGGSGNLAVRAVSWCRGGKKIVSAGDDGVVRVWDLSAGIGGGVDSDKRAMVHLSGHGDAVRSCVVLSVKREEGDDGDSGDNKKWKEVVVSGSYDHTIRVWDIESKETEKCLSIMNHGVPVEALLVLPPSFFKNTASSSSKNKNIPTTPLIVSAGGTILKIWNPLTGKCLGELQTKHSKTITSCTSATISKEVEDGGKTVQYKRIITGGLDGLIRVYSADQIFTSSSSGEKILHFLHGVKVQHPITALGMSPDQTRFVVGTSTGIVLVRQRSLPPSTTTTTTTTLANKKRKREPKPGTYAYFYRGADTSVVEEEAEDTFMVFQEKKKKLNQYDKMLKRFEYGKALDEALERRDPYAVAAVLEELGKRKGLIIALSNRDEETLEPILSFTMRYIVKPRYTSLLVGVANLLCDIYRPIMGQSETIDELFEKLRRSVALECKAQKALLKIVGQIDAIAWGFETQRMERALEKLEG